MILYLLPTFLSEPNNSMIPPAVLAAANECDFFIVENARSARRFLRAIGFTKNFDTEVVILEMDKHQNKLIPQFTEFLKAGKFGGLLSEAGVPCVADPGNLYVAQAQRLGAVVRPISGPSSLLMALMGSGFNGQQFSFQGYLPVQPPQRKKKIQELENLVIRTGATQLFIEAPYRNQPLLNDILEVCNENTELCLAIDISLSTELLKTQRINEWRKSNPEIHKKYVVFLLGSSR